MHAGNNASETWCGLVVDDVPTQETEQFRASGSASECDSSDDMPKACFNSTVSTVFGDFSSSTSDTTSLPSTPRDLGEATPSPNIWGDGSFAQQFRKALEEATNRRSSPDDGNVDVASNFGDCERESEGTEWPLSQVTIKNTFINIESPTTVMDVCPVRRAWSLPTSPFAHVSAGRDDADVVFKWTSVAMLSASQEGELVKEDDREDSSHAAASAYDIRFGSFDDDGEN